MTAVNAKDYYKANIDQEKEYVPIAVARKVKEGETVTVDSVFGIPAKVSAPEDGYEVTATNEHAFLTKAEFKKEVVSADKLELPVAKEDLTAEDLKDIKPVKKGEEIVVNVGITIITRADHDGFLLKTEEGNVFLTNLELTSTFNYAGKKFETQKELVVANKNEPPIKGIILDKETTFAFKAGEYTAPAGSLLYPNPKDEDGYTVQPIKLPNAELRVLPKAKQCNR